MAKNGEMWNLECKYAPGLFWNGNTASGNMLPVLYWQQHCSCKFVATLTTSLLHVCVCMHSKIGLGLGVVAVACSGMW